MRASPSTIQIIGVQIDHGVKRRVFRRGDRIIDRNRGIIHGIDRDVQGTDIAQATVGDGVIDTIRAIEVSRRGIGVATIGRNRNTATLVRGKGAGHDGEGITIEIQIVGSPDRSGVKRGVFRRGDRIIDRNRGIVDGIDRDVEGADIRQATVGDGVIDAIRAIEVSGRGIGVTAIGRNGDRTALGVAKVPATTVRASPSRSVSLASRSIVECKRRVFRRGNRIIDRNRGIVHGIHRDVEGADIVRLPSVTV